MTYYKPATYCTGEKKYEWSAFTEADLLSDGDGNFGCGDTFTMPASATVCMSTYDNDSYLSGDEYYNEHAADSYGQKAYVDGAPIGSQLYAECYHVLKGSDGKTYYLIEIEVEGYNGYCDQDYFTFYGAVPPAGTELTVVNTCNVTGCMVDYDCLANCDVAPPNTPPTFSNAPENCITVDENTTFVIDLDASDADGDTLTYSLAGGADESQFQIDSATGELTFVGAPDYEAPGDFDGDNTYEVMVRVSDGNGGEETKLLTVCVSDVAEGNGTCTVIEAETMDLCGYTVEDRGDASDGAGIKLCSYKGYATTTYSGPDGVFDMTLRVMDESDGQGAIAVYVNGVKVKYIALNENDGGSGLDGESTWSDVVIEDLALNAGDTITLKGIGDCGEYARIDKIEICERECEPCVTIEAEDMCAYNFKTVHGANASGNELVKLTTDYCGGINDGKLSTTFKGCDGTYSVKITAQDENDGQSTLIVKVDGVIVGTIVMDGDGDGAGDDNGTFSEFTLEGVEIGYGQEIAIYAQSDGGEFVRIDKIELCQEVQPELGSIGDTVWFDADGDGLQDADEAGVANVTVTLLDGDGNEVATQTTDGNGNYLFEDLAAGDYQVVFELPAGGFAFTTPNNETGPDGDAGDSDADATGATGTITLAEGEDNTTVDAGIVELPGSLSGRYFIDVNTNDVDDDEPGVEGVIVELLNADGSGTGIFTSTGANGEYSFTGLAAGTYGVKFTDDVSGLTLIAPNVGTDDAIDSDAIDLGGGMSQILDIEVVAGENTPDNDAGVQDPGTASIGDRVWIDANGNGLQDDGEVGLDGVTVTLFDDTNTQLAQTTTANGGKYLFTGLLAGSYYVQFAEADTFDFTTQDTGTDDSIDSDANISTGLTGEIVLGIGEENLTVDAGLVDENDDPTPQNDEGKGCYDEVLCIDVLANDTDPDDDTLAVTTVNGVAIGATPVDLGDAVTVYVDATGGLCFDGSGNEDVAALLSGDDLTFTYAYAVDDGKGGTGTADVAVTFCGATDTVEKICASVQDVLVTMDLNGSQAELWNITLSSTDARFNGYFEEAYCVDHAAPLADGVVSTVEASISILSEGCLDASAFADYDEVTGTSVTAGNILEHAGEINWIINNRDAALSSFTDTEVQSAIWFYSNDNPSINPFYDVGADGVNDYADIVALADDQADYEVPEGGLVGAILNPDVTTSDPAGTDQPFIIGLDLYEDCIC